MRPRPYQNLFVTGCQERAPSQLPKEATARPNFVVVGVPGGGKGCRFSGDAKRGPTTSFQIRSDAAVGSSPFFTASATSRRTPAFTSFGSKLKLSPASCLSG